MLGAVKITEAMAKVKCNIDGKETECKVIENMGFQGGVHVRAVEYEGKERIVQRYNGEKIYRLRTVMERLG